MKNNKKGFQQQKNKSKKSKQNNKKNDLSSNFEVERIKYKIDIIDLIKIIIVLKCVCGDNCDKMPEDLNTKTIRKLYKKLEDIINRKIIIK